MMQKRMSQKKLMLDIVVFVLLFAILGAVLLFEQKGYRADTNTEESNLLEEDAWNAVKNENAGAIAENAPKCLLLRDHHDPNSKMLADNFSYTLTTLNVNVTVKDVEVPHDTEEDDTPPKRPDTATEDQKSGKAEVIDVSAINYQSYDDIVICFPEISLLESSIESLRTWLNKGGHLLFAGGIEEKTDLTVWSDILGVDPSQEAIPVMADSLRFNTDLLAGANGREFSDDVFSGEVMDVAASAGSTVHISTAQEEEPIPLLWEHPAENGKVFVCNTDLMESKNDRGIIAAVYTRFYPVYAYPVINACVYCIDDCPSPIPAGYEKNVVTQYGYTIGDFYANVWMPSMQQLAEKYNIKYSTFAIQTYDDNTEGDFNNTDNREASSYYASLILNLGGEVGIHGYNHQPLVLEGYQFDEENAGYKTWPNVISMLNSVKAAINYTESLTDDLHVEAYVAPSNIISNEALTEMLSQVENLRVYAGIYTGTTDQFLQEFEVMSNGVVYCPRLTADMQMEDSEWWTQLNELNYHYVESNFIHPDDILDEQRSDGGDFKQMLSGYTQMIEWNQNMKLRDTTISECGGAVQRYCNLNYSQTYQDHVMTIKAEGLIDSAYMMIRTNGEKIVSADGGEISELSEGVYILEINKPEVTIKTVDQ